MKCNKILGSFVLAFLTAGTLAAQEVGIGYDYDSFDRDLDPWHLAKISLSQKTSLGSIIGRLNRAQRFGDVGYQGEIDFYPSIGDGQYLYLNVGYSNSEIFPSWRSGAEFFQTLPSSMEASLGIRLLQFSGEPVKIFTGSVSKYWGSFLFTLRPYYVPDNIGDSLSASVMARYYFDDDNSASLTVGSGVAAAVDVNQIFFEQRSKKISLDGSFRVSDKVSVAPGLSLQEFEFFPNTYRRQTSYSLGFKFPF